MSCLSQYSRHKQYIIFVTVGTALLCLLYAMNSHNQPLYMDFSNYLESRVMSRTSDWSPRVKRLNTVKCDVDIVTPDKKQALVSPSKTHPVCTASVYRERLKSDKYFPSEGLWMTIDSKTLSMSFVPSFCRFLPEYWNVSGSKSPIRECVVQNKLIRVVLMGDSHGGRTFDALLDLLKLHNFKCKLTRQERENKRNIFQIDTRYYNTTHLNSSVIRTGDRACATCRSRLYKCTTGSTALEVELLAFNFVLDTTMTVQLPAAIKYPAGTTQELLLRHYLRDRMPDILILHAPFLHSIHRARNSYIKVHADLQYLNSLLQLYLPERTKIFWIPAPRLYPNAKLRREHRFPSWDGMTPIEHLNMDNTALFDVIKGEIMAPHSRTLAFFDAIALTCPLGHHTDASGVHFGHFYYRTIMYQMWQLLCET